MLLASGFAFVSGLVVGYFLGVYRKNIANVKTKVESAVKEEFKI